MTYLIKWSGFSLIDGLIDGPLCSTKKMIIWL